MKKSDLKTGMIVENEIGQLRVVALNTDHGDILIDLDNGQFMSLNNLNEDLSSGVDFVVHGMNTIEVYKPKDDLYGLEFTDYIPVKNA